MERIWVKTQEPQTDWASQMASWPVRAKEWEMGLAMELY